MRRRIAKSRKYPKTIGQVKTEILDAICWVTEWHRRHARKMICQRATGIDFGPRRPRQPVRTDQRLLQRHRPARLGSALTQADPVTTREQIALIYANLLELAHRRGRVEHRVKRNTVHLSCTKLKTRAS